MIGGHDRIVVRHDTSVREYLDMSGKYVLLVVGSRGDPDLRDAVLDEATRRLAEQANGHKPVTLDPAAATAALAEFHGLWQALTPTEQRRLIRLLVERVAVDAAAERVSITFRPTGIATLGADDAGAEASEPELQEVAA